MAVYHFHLKHGNREKGASTGSQRHAQYISREGAYAGRGSEHAAYVGRENSYERRGDLVHIEHRNFPAWASDEPAKFWKAADQYERTNANLYSEMEIAIPRELSAEARINAIREFVDREIGNKFPTTIAIHNPKALDGGEQPHAHIMFSARRVDDGIERRPSQFFKRANSASPEKGGALKDQSIYAKATLYNLRRSWANVANRALEREGHRARIDHRSFRARGIDRVAEPKLGPHRSQKIKTGHDVESRENLHAMRSEKTELDKLRSKIRTEERVIEAYEQSPDKGGFGGLATIRKAVRIMEQEEQGHSQDRSKSMFRSRDRDDEKGRER